MKHIKQYTEQELLDYLKSLPSSPYGDWIQTVTLGNWSVKLIKRNKILLTREKFEFPYQFEKSWTFSSKTGDCVDKTYEFERVEEKYHKIPYEDCHMVFLSKGNWKHFSCERFYQCQKCKTIITRDSIFHSRNLKCECDK